MDAPPTGGDRAAAAQAQASGSPDPARPRQPQPRQQVEPPAAPNLAAGPVSAEAQAVQPEQVAEDRPVSGVASSAALARAADLAGGVLTELGGVLFLINAMQQLDLPACFEPDWRLASQVGPWGVLELLGRGLLTLESPPSRQVGDFAEEPLWTALAAIDGRQPGQLPAAQFTAPPRQPAHPRGVARLAG
jgi:hypothetical protein